MTEYEFIRAEKASFPVRAMCRTLDASKSGYYEWLDRGPSERQQRRSALAEKVAEAHEASRRTYGSPRIREALVQQGEVVSEKMVASVMQEIGLVARPRRAFRVTTDSRFTENLAPNLLDRNFVATRPNEVWVTDVTALPVLGGWVFLASIIDLYARRVVGWELSESNDTDLALAALRDAIRKRRPPPGVLHHSDRGSPYGSKGYIADLDQYGFVRSMSRKGNCWDNACMESFFSTLKLERVDHRRYGTRDEAKRDVIEWIEIVYNRQRRHSKLGYRSPAQFEQLANAA